MISPHQPKTGKLGRGLAMIGGDDDDAVVIETAGFQVLKKSPQRLIHLMQLESDAVAEARSIAPVGRRSLRQIVYAQFVNVHRLGVEQDRPILLPVRVLEKRLE